MSDVVWIALIIAGFGLIIYFSLLFVLPDALKQLVGRVSRINANTEGVSINFFEAQAQKVVELRGGETPSAPMGTNWKNVSILWVDDFPENNFLEASMFEALGADVRFARNNSAALAAAQGRAPTLIISDINRLNDMETGLDIPADFSKASQPLPPLVYYTGHRTKETTPDGYPVAIYPAELFSQVVSALGEEE